MATSRLLTDRTIKALPPAPKGRRLEVFDSRLPGFGVRISDQTDPSRPGKAGRISFVLYVRYDGRTPSRRTLGRWPAIGLADAREKARRWLAQIEAGHDPAVLEASEREQREHAAALASKRTFGAAAQSFVAEKLSTERKGLQIEREIRREFASWWDRPIADITDLDVLSIVNAKKRNAPAQARNLLGTAKRLFGWAIDQRIYGLNVSPCDRLKPKSIIGKKKKRQRVLSDEEIFAFWVATKTLRQPYRAIYQLLLLNGLRLNEIADATQQEFPSELRRLWRHQNVDWSKIPNNALTWTISENRMKGRDGEARSHAVPLTEWSLRIFADVPHVGNGPFCFSTTEGEKAVWVGDKIKKKLDARMLRILRVLARRRGDDPAGVAVEHWVNHDLRRTVRTNLSKLRIPEEVREAILAHARPGITGVYDVHDYLQEKREALTQWQSRLASIIAVERIATVAKPKCAK